jgi:hypothetical protein
MLGSHTAGIGNLLDSQSIRPWAVQLTSAARAAEGLFSRSDASLKSLKAIRRKALLAMDEYATI